MVVEHANLRAWLEAYLEYRDGTSFAPSFHCRCNKYRQRIYCSYYKHCLKRKKLVGTIVLRDGLFFYGDDFVFLWRSDGNIVIVL